MCLKMFLLDNIQLLANLDEGGDGAVELLAGVGCGELDADTCLALRYNRVVEAGYIDVFLLLSINMSKMAMEAPQMAGANELENK